MLHQALNIYKTTFLLVFLLFAGSCKAQQKFEITVSAGGFDRSETAVSFHFPDTVEQGVYQMESDDGETIYLQVNDENKGSFILDNLEAGASRVFNMTTEPVSVDPAIVMDMNANTVTYKSGDNDILTYYHGDNVLPEGVSEVYRRGGYMHPVYSPKGTVLTNHLNPEVHTHQYGIWSAWTKTSFEGRQPDFWNVNDGTGRVDHKDSVQAAWQGPVHAGFEGINYFVDLSSGEPVVALNEEWKVTIYRPSEEGRYFIFDLVLTQTANTGKPFILPEYRYGGIGFRGNRQWNDGEGIQFLTSTGLGREGNFTRARWCHIGGYVDGKLAGITVMDNPGNLRHPQPMRIHPKYPFFNYAPEQLGQIVIEPGSPYVAKYRFVTYDGEPDPSALDQIWNDYAYPPGVTVSKK